jgi:hypothetical protein
MDITGGAVRRHTNNSFSDSQPVFNPANGVIAFTSNRDGNEEIYTIASGAAATVEPTRLTTDTGSDSQPTWNRAGSTLAFVSTRDGKAEIYTMTATGTTPTRLTNNVATDTAPSFSPLADKIAYQSDLFGNNDIYYMNIDGTRRIRVTTQSSSEESPSWGPASATPTPTPTAGPTATPTPTATPIPANAPANNMFANAQTISGATNSVTGSNVGANKQRSEPNHGDNPGGASVWYKWQADASGSVAFSTAGSNFDTLLSIYTGISVSALTRIASNDDAEGIAPASRASFNAVEGTIYYIAVDGFGGATGSIQLAWQSVSAPVNDDFVGAATISGTPGTLTSNTTNVNATKESGEPNHAGNSGGASVWYKWQAPASGSATFNTSGSDFDTLLGIYTGTNVSALTQIASNDDASTSTNTSAVTFSAVLNRDYYIAVDGYNAAIGNISLQRSMPGITVAPRTTSSSTASPVMLSSSSAAAATSNVKLTFTGALDPATASDIGNYRVVVGGVVVRAESATYNAATQSVTLTLPAGALRAGSSGTVSWSGLLDAQGRTLASGQASFTAR